MDVILGMPGELSGELVEFAASVFVRGAALLVLAFGATLLLRRAPAAVRHHVWTLTMAGLISLPLLSGALPDWRVSVPGTSGVARLLVPAFPSSGPSTVAARVDPEAGLASTNVARDERTAGSPTATPEDRQAATAGVAAPTMAWLPWSDALLLGWTAGFILLIGRLGFGLARATLFVRRAAPVTDRGWNVLVSALSLRCGLDANVRLVSTPEVNVPMAWGILNRWLVLPEGIESWPEDRRRVVVLHELAHLRRRDCFVQALAQLALAVHWPNPLAWLATARMRSERERACDDAVLVAGVRGPTYAHHLVEIARGLSRPGRPARAAVAMARPSELESRVLAILDDRLSRGDIGRRAVSLGLVGLFALLLPVAALQPAPPGNSHTETALIPDEASTTRLAAEAGVDDPNPAASLQRPVQLPGTQASPAEAASDDVETVPADQAATVGDTIEERVFRALERALGSDDPAMRRQVAHTLGAIESPRGVDLLVALTRDHEAGVRKEAAWALGMIESARGVEPLLPLLDDPRPEVRKEAIWALGMIESADGVAPLLPLLDDDDPRVRKEAAWALGMIESSTAVEALAGAFASEDVPEIRAEIIWALGMIEDREAASTIVDALEDPDSGVRAKALWALGMVMN
jgi:beta-lactamase regulating signal transducer with metallopeptidase domain